MKKNWLVGDNGKTRWSTECDFPSAKSNIYTACNLMMFDRSKCSAYCLSVKRCTHFAWIMPSTCFVKDFRGAPIVQIVDANATVQQATLASYDLPVTLKWRNSENDESS